MRFCSALLFNTEFSIPQGLERLVLASSADVTLLIEAVNSSRSDVLNRTLASTRTPTPSGSKENGSGSRKGFTTTTSALAIAALGLFTFAVLTWAKRHQDKRRARGEHVIDGIEYVLAVWPPCTVARNLSYVAVLEGCGKSFRQVLQHMLYSSSPLLFLYYHRGACFMQATPRLDPVQ